MRARTKIEIMWPEPIDLEHVYRSRVQQNTKIQCIIMSITCQREPTNEVKNNCVMKFNVKLNAASL